MRKIVVGVDESDGAREALRWAVREGELRGCAVTAVLCWGYLDQHHGPGGTTEFDPAYHEADAAAALDAIVDQTVGDRGVHTTIVNDLAPRGLLEASADADLLVLGARGSKGLTALLVGSVSSQCLHYARVPTAIIRKAEPTDPPRVVVGVDGSETSLRALQWGVDAAAARGGVVEAIHAWSFPLAIPTALTETAIIERASDELVERAVEKVDTSALDRPIVMASRSGSGGAVLASASHGADLVVVGSRGLGGFKGLLLGSVSHQVVNHAACPVVVIPTDHH